MRGKGTEPSVNDRYTQWKSLVPVLYDWLANHNLVWPSLSCRYLYALGFFLYTGKCFRRCIMILRNFDGSLRLLDTSINYFHFWFWIWEKCGLSKSEKKKINFWGQRVLLWIYLRAFCHNVVKKEMALLKLIAEFDWCCECELKRLFLFS